MEMYWNEEPKVATNVFELGLKLFSKEPEYVLRYLEFLLQQNNANSKHFTIILSATSLLLTSIDTQTLELFSNER